LEQEIDDELRFHVEILVERHVAGGMKEEEARRAVMGRFHRYQTTRAQLIRGRTRGRRLERRRQFLAGLGQDLRQSWRQVSKRPGFAVMAVLTLAIGIGVNTTAFSMVEAFLLRPLPYPAAERLLVLWTTNPERGIRRWRLSIPDYVDLRERTRTMDVAGVMDETFNLSGDLDAERLRGNYVTPGFFRVLGVSPALGRGFAEEEGTPEGDRVAVISHELWQRRFGYNTGLLGSSILLDGAPHTLVGIMPPGFWVGSPGVDVWVAGAPSGEERRDAHVLGVLGRVREGFSIRQASDEAIRILTSIAAAHPETSAGNGGHVETLRDAVFDRGFKAASAISMASVALVLLIACANVASLLLTQAAGRGQEVALREALGARHSRIARQFFSESLLVAGGGGLGGVGLSVLGIRGLVSVIPPDVPRGAELTLSPRVLLFTATITVLTAVLCGMAPALRSGKAHLARNLRDGGGPSGRLGGRLQKALVAGEVAMTTVLLISSALLLRGFREIRLGDMGLDRSDVLAMRTQLPGKQYPDTASVNQFYVDLAARLEEIPGVQEVGGTNILPGQGGRVVYYVPGEGDIEDPSSREWAAHRYVLPGYLDAMDIPILAGRGFAESDRMGAPRVAVVSESLAQRDWPGSDPIGRVITGASGSWEVVGVVGDTWNPGISDEPSEMIYFSALQARLPFMDWAVEASVPLAALVAPVQQAVRDVDPTIPAFDVMSLDALIDQGLGGSLVVAKVMGALALIALVLALVGVHGVVAYTVSQRTHELGVRMSLGARGGDVMAMVVRQGMTMAVVGILFGVGLALAVTRGLSHFLFGVSPLDPPTFTAVSLALLCAATAATVLSARRATKVDPIVALMRE